MDIFIRRLSFRLRRPSQWTFVTLILTSVIYTIIWVDSANKAGSAGWNHFVVGMYVIYLFLLVAAVQWCSDDVVIAEEVTTLVVEISRIWTDHLNCRTQFRNIIRYLTEVTGVFYNILNCSTLCSAHDCNKVNLGPQQQHFLLFYLNSHPVNLLFYSFNHQPGIPQKWNRKARIVNGQLM